MQLYKVNIIIQNMKVYNNIHRNLSQNLYTLKALQTYANNYLTDKNL